MLKRIMVYAGPEKKKTVLATVLIFAAVLMQVLPFLLAYQLIAPLVLGQGLLPEDIFRNVGAILLCLVLYGVLYTLGLSVSHEAAFGILEKIRISMQKKMENQPLGVIQERGVGMIKRLFVDDVESMEALLAHAIPEGFGNVLIPVVVYVVMFFCGLEAGAHVPVFRGGGHGRHDENVPDRNGGYGQLLPGGEGHEQYHHRVHQRYGGGEGIR